MNSAHTNGHTSTIRSEVLRYAARKWKTVLNHVPVGTDGACTCGKKPCPSAGKHPRGGDGWENRATSDAGRLKQLLDVTPECNPGILLGPESDYLADTDFDCQESTVAGPILLPPTTSKFGRAGVVTHQLYRIVGEYPN